MSISQKKADIKDLVLRIKEQVDRLVIENEDDSNGRAFKVFPLYPDVFAYNPLPGEYHVKVAGTPGSVDLEAYISNVFLYELSNDIAKIKANLDSKAQLDIIDTYLRFKGPIAEDGL